MEKNHREIFSQNLQKYIERSGKTQKELAEIIGVSGPTMHEWVKGKKLPRMDKIEKLADYFGILKSDLIENKGKEREEVQKKADSITEAVLRMKTDKEFLCLIESLCKLDAKQVKSVSVLLDSFLQ